MRAALAESFLSSQEKGQGGWFRTGNLEVGELGCSPTPQTLGLWKVNNLLGEMESWDPLAPSELGLLPSPRLSSVCWTEPSLGSSPGTTPNSL